MGDISIYGHYILLCDSEGVKFDKDGSVCVQPFISMEISQLNNSMEPLQESILQHIHQGAGVRASSFCLCPDDSVTQGNACSSQDPSSFDTKQ